MIDNIARGIGATAQYLSKVIGRGNRRPTSIGTRARGCSMANWDLTSATSGFTMKDVIEIPARGCRFRLRYANASLTQTTHIAKAYVGNMANPTQVAANTLVQATFNNGTTNDVTLGVASAANITNFVVSDWVEVTTIARTDGAGLGELIRVTTLTDTAAVVSAMYGSVYNATGWTPWSTEQTGHQWYTYNTNGDSTINFSSTTLRQNTLLHSIDYQLESGQVITLCAIGDSITEGYSGTMFGGGWLYEAMKVLRIKHPGVSYEFCNLGWSGTSMGSEGGRLQNFLNTGANPSIIIFPVASPNDLPTPTILQSYIDGSRNYWQRTRYVAKDYPQLNWTILPVSYAAKVWGSSDSLRRAYNNEVRGLVPQGLMLADAAAMFTTGTDTNGQDIFNPLYTTEGLHPNDAGYALMGALMAPGVDYLVQPIDVAGRLFVS